jgi:hypothetical protein
MSAAGISLANFDFRIDFIADMESQTLDKSHTAKTYTPTELP